MTYRRGLFAFRPLDYPSAFRVRPFHDGANSSSPKLFPIGPRINAVVVILRRGIAVVESRNTPKILFMPRLLRCYLVDFLGAVLCDEANLGFAAIDTRPATHATRSHRVKRIELHVMFSMKRQYILQRPVA